MNKLYHFLKHYQLSDRAALGTLAAVVSTVLVLNGCAKLEHPTTITRAAATSCLVAEQISASITPKMVSGMSLDALRASSGALNSISAFCANGENLNAGEIAALGAAVDTLKNDLLNSTKGATQ